jgi:hypothetical protein
LEENMKQHVIVAFDGEPVVFYNDEGEKTKYQLYRYLEGDEEGFFVHWRGEKGSWLETGRNGCGVDAATVAAFWPKLAARAWLITMQEESKEES